MKKWIVRDTLIKTSIVVEAPDEETAIMSILDRDNAGEEIWDQSHVETEAEPIRDSDSLYRRIVGRDPITPIDPEALDRAKEAAKEAGVDYLAAIALDNEVLRANSDQCDACGRSSIDCSQNPCAAVLADRES